MAVAWPDGVNTRAYGMETGYLENTEAVEMKSGRRVVYLKNSSPRKAFSFNLYLNDQGSNSEYKKFMQWYENTARSGSENFMFPDLITHSGTKEYQFSGTPTARGQKNKEVTISVVEI